MDALSLSAWGDGEAGVLTAAMTSFADANVCTTTVFAAAFCRLAAGVEVSPRGLPRRDACCEPGLLLSWVPGLFWVPGLLLPPDCLVFGREALDGNAMGSAASSGYSAACANACRGRTSSGVRGSGCHFSWPSLVIM